MPAPGSELRARLSGITMGTRWSLSWCAPDRVCEADVLDAVTHMFSRIIAQMSTWEPESQISRFNRLPAGEVLPIDREFSEVLSLALDIANQSDGAFDPTLGGETARRGFGPNGTLATDTGYLTGPQAWSAIGPWHGELRQPGGVQLDLSGIAKGYAVDCMGKVLASLGVTRFLAEIGGEFVGKGVRPDGLPGWVDLDPLGPSADVRVGLCDLALATSGAYRQSRRTPGGVVSHIVPAGEKAPVSSLASVTVLGPSCAVADAWATALFALGRDRGTALAKARNLKAVFRFWSGEESWLSPAARRLMD